jgi:transcription-repair coupling factor (superfamily II helicase)
MIDRFGALPEPTENLLTLIQIKLNARAAHIAKIDVGLRGALVSFWNDRFPKPEGLLAYVARLGDTAKLRPDMKLSITRGWKDPKARLHGVLQLSRGLAKVAA